jgi:hypothetical protein
VAHQPQRAWLASRYRSCFAIARLQDWARKELHFQGLVADAAPQGVSLARLAADGPRLSKHRHSEPAIVIPDRRKSAPKEAQLRIRE